MKLSHQRSGVVTGPIWCMAQVNLPDEPARQGSSLSNSVAPSLRGDESDSFTTETRRHRNAQRFVAQSLIALALVLSNLGLRAVAQTPTASPTPQSANVHRLL